MRQLGRIANSVTKFLGGRSNPCPYPIPSSEDRKSLDNLSIQSFEFSQKPSFESCREEDKVKRIIVKKFKHITITVYDATQRPNDKLSNLPELKSISKKDFLNHITPKCNTVLPNDNVSSQVGVLRMDAISLPLTRIYTAENEQGDILGLGYVELPETQLTEAEKESAKHYNPDSDTIPLIRAEELIQRETWDNIKGPRYPILYTREALEGDALLYNLCTKTGDSENSLLKTMFDIILENESPLFLSYYNNYANSKDFYERHNNVKIIGGAIDRDFDTYYRFARD